uniref:Serine/threonine-protein kinase ULK3 n=3 Tax=Hirondellea gigas TaxID=1518452 RepID=A0A6A7FWC7_9CRUS
MAGKSNPTPPLKVANYIIGDKIGSGGYADVYKAYKTADRKECVAIKAVLRSTLSSGSTDNLITEIRLLKQLNHDHIVQLEDFMCDENYIYIVMEYCSGGDLSHFIKLRHRLSESACQRFLQQLASALKYMREENVSHFDLKPQNILLASRRNPKLKIGDFGLAQLMTESEFSSKVKGSPLYMAPEILLKKQYDAKVDLWSVGVILYECLFGKAPYSSSTMEELIHRIKTDKQIQIPHNTSISSKCRDLLVRCLERDPEKRIGFEEFFNHPFVDLEHKPCPENIDKARALLCQAVEHDEKLNYEEALTLYTESLLYLVPTMHAENDANKRTSLRRSVTQYLSRTEILKKLLSQNGLEIQLPSIPYISSDQTESAESPSINAPSIVMLNSFTVEHHQNVEELLSLASTTATMTGAIDIAKSGELYEREASYSIALEKYELALGKLLSLLSNEPHGRRRDLLLDVIKTWMKQAEQIKGILDTRKREVELLAAAGTDTSQSKQPEKNTFSLADKFGSKVKSESSDKKRESRLERQKSRSRNSSASSIISVLTPISGLASSFQSTKLLTEADYERNCSLQ